MGKTNLIEDVLDSCEDVETPRTWIYWGTLCAVAAAASNQYHLKAFKGLVTYYCNLYVILMGESGLGKKFPVDLARNLVDKADITRVIYGRSSIQAIVQEAARSQTREGKEPILDSRMFVVNGELSTAIIQDPDSLTILTDIYDHHETWTNKLKGDGNEKLKDTATTCLFGTSPAHFYDSIPQVNIEGGYIGRNLVVLEETRYKDLDMFRDEDDAAQGFPYEKFVPHLIKIGKSGGRIIPNADARQLLNTWRRQWREAKHDDKTGFMNRVPDHVIKTAMCLCLADYESSLVITTEHIAEAIEKVTNLAYASKRASSGVGADPMAKQTKMIIDFLLTAESNTLTRRQLLSKGYGNYDAAMLDRILETLDEMKWIEKTRIAAGKNSDISVALAGEPLKQYQQFLKRRKK